MRLYLLDFGIKKFIVIAMLLSGFVYAEDKINLKVGYIPITDHLLLGVAESRNKNGFSNFSLETVKFPDMGTLSEGLRSGSLDGGFLLAPLAFQAGLKGARIKILALGHRNGSAFLVRVKSEINSIEDLKNKTIAIPHRFSTHNMLLHMYTSSNGLVPGKDFKVIELIPTEMPASMANGSIDGYIVAEPFAARGELLGIGKIFVLSKDIWKDHPDCLFVMRDEVISKYPQAAEELVRQLVISGIYTEKHRDEAAIVGAKFLGQPLEALKLSLSNPKDRVTFLNLRPEISELNKTVDYMSDKMGLFPQKPDIQSISDLSIINKVYEEIKNQNID
jgi:NitT/TauT family transport system substrate-binding protein